MIRYKKEFKQSLVEMHNQGRSYTDLSAEYGPSVDSIKGVLKIWFKIFNSIEKYMDPKLKQSALYMNVGKEILS